MSSTQANIWVDADACPRVIKDILFRAANRKQIQLTLVANQYIQAPKSPFIRSMRVEKGFDVADNRIIELAAVGDLVVTADIPLAAGVIDKGAIALNPRGELYTRDNIAQRLSMRNFMEELRSSGEQIGGPDAINQADRQRFANELDRYLNQI
ncbi:MAG: YaiI/YqxD family protein [Gammaproteobacteria bacterium]|nr:YaiI/YqxD family protein [Gammaproteobacteria bacterium]